MKRSEFNALINRNDEVGMHAVGRVLVNLFRRQTEDEQVANDTRHDNKRGFNAGDARKGSITAKYYLKHGKLEDWQLDVWRSRVKKYYRQMAEEAAKKGARA